MKLMVGVGVFGKQDMIRWLLEGIASSFPNGTRVVFFFEACTDESFSNFCALAPEILRDYAWSYGKSDTHLLEHGVHNWLIRQMLAELEIDALVVPHDDNRFCGPRIVTDIQRVLDTYGDKLGWVGGRDGYEAAYHQMLSSPFSSSDAARAKLPVGEFKPRSQLNTGPVIYTRRLVEQVGTPDMAFEGWYWWDDYSLRAKHAGLTNVLLSMDCLHEKFGQLQNNPQLFDGDLVARDLRLLNERWRQVLGYNPI